MTRHHTETMRAEVARANPTTLVASAHFWAKSLKSACREQVSLALPWSTLNALQTTGLSCTVVLAGMPPPSLAGCLRVAAACSEAALSVSLFLLQPLTRSMVRQGLIGTNYFWWHWCELDKGIG